MKSWQTIIFCFMLALLTIAMFWGKIECKKEHQREIRMMEAR